MKIIKKLNVKRILKSLKTGVLSANIFFFLFAAFFCSLALAVTLTVTHIDNINPKNIVLGIEKELNWGAEKLRDDITCMAINIENTELIKKK